MTTVLLTQNDNWFLGPIAKLLGLILNGIFSLLDLIKIPNAGLSIILLTIVIYLCLLPLTIKQQKFSKLSAKMNPELQVIRDKYKGKKDQESMQAMQLETQAVYNKYGVSQVGSCVQLLIQMPILIALYQVISNMPAYVTKIKEAFYPLVVELMNQRGAREFFQNEENFKGAMQYRSRVNSADFLDISNKSEAVQNTFIDVLNKATPTDLASLEEAFPALATNIANTMESLEKYNNFLSINMAHAPSYLFSQSWNGGSNIVFLGLLAAVSIPILSAVTQWVNFKLMPQPATQTDNDQANQMMQTMKMMNKIMPLMSAYFCFILPAGMGLYWVAGAVVRSIQQVIINRQMDKIDIDEMIKINVQKRREKLERRGIDPDKVNTFATMNTRNAGAAGSPGETPKRSIAEKAMQNQKRSTEIEAGSSTAASSASANAKPGSLFAKANMVREYNERNNKK